MLAAGTTVEKAPRFLHLSVLRIARESKMEPTPTTQGTQSKTLTASQQFL